MAKLNILADEENPTIVRNAETCEIFDRAGHVRTYKNLESIVITGEKQKRQLLIFKSRKIDLNWYQVAFWMLVCLVMILDVIRSY